MKDKGVFQRNHLDNCSEPQERKSWYTDAGNELSTLVYNNDLPNIVRNGGVQIHQNIKRLSFGKFLFKDCNALTANATICSLSWKSRQPPSLAYTGACWICLLMQKST